MEEVLRQILRGRPEVVSHRLETMPFQYRRKFRFNLPIGIVDECMVVSFNHPAKRRFQVPEVDNHIVGSPRRLRRRANFHGHAVGVPGEIAALPRVPPKEMGRIKAERLADRQHRSTNAYLRPRCHASTSKLGKFQISFAYSSIVRSEENFPERATLMSARRVHSRGLA